MKKPLQSLPYFNALLGMFPIVMLNFDKTTANNKVLNDSLQNAKKENLVSIKSLNMAVYNEAQKFKIQ